MLRKLLATLALVAVAVLAGPVAAHAAGYVAADLITVSGSQTAGSTVTVTFDDGAFAGGEQVSVAVSGEGSVTLAALRAATVDTHKTATSLGAVNLKVTLPSDATGSYTVTAIGLTSQNIGTSTITVVAADGAGLASAGFDAPFVLIYSAAGALLLGLGLVIALRFTLRRRAVTA
ncbi:hypothetical protein [Cryobacterium sp. TMT1-66-1]|uniref:hypothetical protein n=1 Tax=Cryobacterium sp. TMT1-66-1 TaxID=1259242 RepID=UPI001069B651|nr:hypothetical protein [Cryobacterium sp. TMT1-66-1]TFD06160.1 hypothetical protein E3T29_10730 [Cryobacterium sp. TMT1-66-1]